MLGWTTSNTRSVHVRSIHIFEFSYLPFLGSWGGAAALARAVYLYCGRHRGCCLLVMRAPSRKLFACDAAVLAGAISLYGGRPRGHIILVMRPPSRGAFICDVAALAVAIYL